MNNDNDARSSNARVFWAQSERAVARMSVRYRTQQPADGLRQAGA
jgi:hypothetical protein